MTNEFQAAIVIPESELYDTLNNRYLYYVSVPTKKQIFL